MPREHSEKGFGLIFVLVSLAIFAIIASSVVSTLTIDAHEITKEAALVNSQISTQGTEWNVSQTAGNTTSPTLSSINVIVDPGGTATTSSTVSEGLYTGDWYAP
jgi:type II secretory pathway pseudopilin PulG